MTKKALSSSKLLSENDMELAREMYLEYIPISQIADKFKVGRTTISYHANKYWKVDREMRKAELYAQFTDAKRVNFTKMSEAAISIITKSLVELSTRNRAPTVQEAKMATQILESLDKITRLDDGNPTDIVAEKPASITDIKKKIMLDPFANTEDIEAIGYEEIDDESRDSES
jgi:predicted DNA-binding protein YlxM (UPF0122 family)